MGVVSLRRYFRDLEHIKSCVIDYVNFRVNSQKRCGSSRYGFARRIGGALGSFFAGRIVPEKNVGQFGLLGNLHEAFFFVLRAPIGTFKKKRDWSKARCQFLSLETRNFRRSCMWHLRVQAFIVRQISRAGYFCRTNFGSKQSSGSSF